MSPDLGCCVHFKSAFIFLCIVNASIEAVRVAKRQSVLLNLVRKVTSENKSKTFHRVFVCNAVEGGNGESHAEA